MVHAIEVKNKALNLAEGALHPPSIWLIGTILSSIVGWCNREKKWQRTGRPCGIVGVAAICDVGIAQFGVHVAAGLVFGLSYLQSGGLPRM